MASSHPIRSASRPTRPLVSTAIGAGVAAVVVLVLLRLVFGLVFGLIGLAIPLGLVAAGLFLLGEQRTRLGLAAIAVGALLIVF